VGLSIGVGMKKQMENHAMVLQSFEDPKEILTLYLMAGARAETTPSITLNQRGSSHKRSLGCIIHPLMR
jgi:hypothetical protein